MAHAWARQGAGPVPLPTGWAFFLKQSFLGRARAGAETAGRVDRWPSRFPCQTAARRASQTGQGDGSGESPSAGGKGRRVLCLSSLLRTRRMRMGTSRGGGKSSVRTARHCGGLFGPRLGGFERRANFGWRLARRSQALAFKWWTALLPAGRFALAFQPKKEEPRRDQR